MTVFTAAEEVILDALRPPEGPLAWDGVIHWCADDHGQYRPVCGLARQERHLAPIEGDARWCEGCATPARVRATRQIMQMYLALREVPVEVVLIERGRINGPVEGCEDPPPDWVCPH